ncbi:hypothetical protein SeMB42_g00914 [Synchytrium endobioticum]|uniref:Derlin n=1 Tax=Synchytrium endobioticum TaxID=286115 RepID=A0A507DNA8_9FUNG|nr:hypothetical protein SeLEV6574_g07939 [Synchytrium endobioticum]TPX53209.1 hypothetical protein SeMB42_g00914 [Synchytrium endobioticum]
MPAVNAPPPSNAMHDAQHWYRSLPLVPRVLLTATVAVSVVGNFVLSPLHIVFHAQSIAYRLQLWRLITPFFFTPKSMDGLFNLYFLFNYSNQLNSSLFAGRNAEFVFFVLFIMTGLDILSFVMKPYILLDGLVMAIVYLWAQVNRDSEVSFMFGFRFKAIYLPLVLVAWDLLAKPSGFPVVKVMGILVGHFYFFLDKIWPEQNGDRRILKTPQFLIAMFPPTPPSGPASFGSGYTVIVPRASAGAPDGLRVRHSWGSGQRLGDS